MKNAIANVGTLIIGIAVITALMGSALGIAALGDFFSDLRGGFPWWALAFIVPTAAGLALWLHVPTGVVDTQGRRVRL